MSIMSHVDENNLPRLIPIFPPFTPIIGDEFLSIRTYDPTLPIVRCLFTKTKRITALDLVYEPGFYAYVQSDKESKLWYNPNAKDDNDLNSLVAFLNVENVFDPRAMQSMGFTAAFFQ